MSTCDDYQLPRVFALGFFVPFQKHHKQGLGLLNFQTKLTALSLSHMISIWLTAPQQGCHEISSSFEFPKLLQNLSIVLYT
jgi:hypothetical protein